MGPFSVTNTSTFLSPHYFIQKTIFTWMKVVIEIKKEYFYFLKII